MNINTVPPNQQKSIFNAFLPEDDAILTHEEAEEFLRLARMELQQVPAYAERIQTCPTLFDTEQN